MKKISNLSGIKVLSKKELKEVNGALASNPYCRSGLCFVTIPNIGEVQIGVCTRYGNCIFQPL